VSAGQHRNTRARIVEQLTRTPDLSARDLATLLGITPANLSRHLITMSRRGQLLTGQRQEETCTVITYAVASAVAA
jgi:DNA-binding MarR family transcriptional regulator